MGLVFELTRTDNMMKMMSTLLMFVVASAVDNSVQQNPLLGFNQPAQAAQQDDLRCLLCQDQATDDNKLCQLHTHLFGVFPRGNDAVPHCDCPAVAVTTKMKNDSRWYPVCI